MRACMVAATHIPCRLGVLTVGARSRETCTAANLHHGSEMYPKIETIDSPYLCALDS